MTSEAALLSARPRYDARFMIGVHHCYTCSEAAERRVSDQCLLRNDTWEDGTPPDSWAFSSSNPAQWKQHEDR